MVGMSIGGSGGVLDDAAAIAIGIADAAGAHIPAMLRCMDLPPIGGLVMFDFNPAQMKFDRRASTYWPMSSGSQNAPTFQGSQQPTITLQKVTFTGETTKLRCDTLLNWMAPPAENALNQLVGAAVGAVANAIAGPGSGPNLMVGPPVLTFQWGPPLFGFFYSVLLTSLGVTYNRFDSTGCPIRADISMTLSILPNPLSTFPTNPTSGGLPGRRSHVLRDGESLQSVAHFYYGRVGLWRRIAEINGIDDPRKVRPGRTVYLPNANELTSGS